MKKSLVGLAFLFIVITYSGKGQEFNAGLKMGLVASQVNGDTYSGYNKAGITFGGFVNRNFTKKWLWQFGLDFKQKGSKYSENESVNFYHVKLNYVEMPLSVRYFHYEKLDFEAGLCLGYLFSSKENIDAYEFKDPNPPFNKPELSSLIGLNYKFSNKWSIGAKYQYSMFPVRYYLEGYEEYLDKNQYNNVVFFTLTYILPSWR